MVRVGIELFGVVDRQLMAGAGSMVRHPLWWHHGSALKGAARVTRRSVCLVHQGLQVAMEAEMPAVPVRWAPQGRHGDRQVVITAQSGGNKRAAVMVAQTLDHRPQVL